MAAQRPPLPPMSCYAYRESKHSKWCAAKAGIVHHTKELYGLLVPWSLVLHRVGCAANSLGSMNRS